MVRELPIVDINGSNYYMDSRLREFRKKVEFPEPLEFLSFDDVINSGVPVSFVQPSKDYISKTKIISCLTEDEKDDLDYLITSGNKDFLKKIPFCKE